MILITGGSGFLGRTVAARIPDARALSSTDLDLRQGDAVDDFIALHRPSVVVHLAARVGGITENMARPFDMYADNVRMDANLLSALRDHPPAHLIAMLSTCMYPDRLPDEAYPLSEDLVEVGDPPPTNAPYAAAKRALWRGTQALHEQYDVPYTSLIPSNLYGPHDHFGEDKSHFLAAAVGKIERARLEMAPTVHFMGTGVALRQHVLSNDVADLIAHLVGSGPLNQSVNVAPDEILSVAELAHLVAEVAGYDGDVVFTGVGPDGQYRKDVSSARLRAATPWASMETPLRDGIATTVDSYRAGRTVTT